MEKKYMFMLAMTEEQMDMVRKGVTLLMQKENICDDELAWDIQMAITNAEEIEEEW